MASIRPGQPIGRVVVARDVAMAIVVTVALVALVGCATGDGSRHTGRVVEPAEPGTSATTGQRWAVRVDLGDGEVAGERQVVVAFDADALTCTDGRPADPGELVAGDVLSFTQVGDDVDTMLPPIVGGGQVQLDCT